MIIALKPPYIPLVQKPYCCNVTCLSMILYRRGFGLFDQEQLARFFHVKIDAKSRPAFNVKLKTFSRTNFDEGIQTIESAGLINRFFRQRNLPLKARAVRASHIPDLAQFIIQELRQNNDLWVEYKTHRTHNVEMIHDSAVESITVTKKTSRVVLVDPYHGYKTRKTIPIATLKTAISEKFGRETGFIVISKKE